MFEVKIPEWSDIVLMTRYENIKPLLREKPNGPLHWIKGRDSADDLRYTAYMWNPEYFDKNWIDHKEVYYNFCKEGDEKYPSKDYQVAAKNVAECKEAIDKFLSGDSKGNGDIYYTHEEFQKYVKKPNEKCDYGYGYDSLMKLMRQHQKADKRMQWFLEERLHDANFHTEGDILSTCDYAKFEEYVTNTNPFKEKFEVCTKTLKKRIKDPVLFQVHNCESFLNSCL